MKKISLITLLAVALILAFAGCASQTPADTSAATTPMATTEATVAATQADTQETMEEPIVIKVAGSTSVGPVIEALSEKYMEKYPNIKIDVEQTDSGSGVTTCGDGTADMGMASRNLKDEETALYPDMKATVLCLDGVAVVVSAQNDVTDLTAEQVKDIYTGEITNWSEVGGDDKDITLYSRESTSGTREAFQNLFLGKDDAGEQIEIDDTMCLIQDSNGAIGTAVQDDATGIGYMSLGIAPQYDVTLVTIDGVEATTDNMINGTYKYLRPFNLLTNGEASDAVAAFIEYCTTDKDAIAYMEEKGYVMAE